MEVLSIPSCGFSFASEYVNKSAAVADVVVHGACADGGRDTHIAMLPTVLFVACSYLCIPYVPHMVITTGRVREQRSANKWSSE